MAAATVDPVRSLLMGFWRLSFASLLLCSKLPITSLLIHFHTLMLLLVGVSASRSCC